MAVGTLFGGNWNVGCVPVAVTVPASATRPDEKTMIPQLAQPPIPRAMATGMPGLPSATASTHFLLVGSGRKPPCHGASGRSLQVLLDHSMIVTRSTGKLAA